MTKTQETEVEETIQKMTEERMRAFIRVVVKDFNKVTKYDLGEYATFFADMNDTLNDFELNPSEEE